ncbi:MAG: virulence RhuM family protein [Streptococcaceae bacterium]|jgi:hypothetical protein|nr:virulence RhuM family protein [Streptococcaceae bacterium]
MSEQNNFQIRNASADFLIFTKEQGADGVNVRVEDENVWLTIESIAELYGKGRSTVAEHIAAIYQEGEQDENSTCRNFRQVASNGKNYNMKHYNLELIISVGYRVKSDEAIHFRQWATRVLKAYTTQGYLLDKSRLENDQIFDVAYFDHLLEEIQEIRASERKFYQKITDIFATAFDYSAESYITQQFFATIQNKLHFAIHGHTAAEVIVNRADAEKEHMGLTNWRNAPKGKILKSDVSIAKNYLSQLEIKDLNEIVSMYLDYALRQARRKVAMSMSDWQEKLDAFLLFNDEQILKDAGKVKAEVAKAFAEKEFEKFRVKQDKEYLSDFDKLLLEADEGKKKR